MNFPENHLFNSGNHITEQLARVKRMSHAEMRKNVPESIISGEIFFEDPSRHKKLHARSLLDQQTLRLFRIELFSLTQDLLFWFRKSV